MAYYSVAGTSPVSFVDDNQNQLEIPLNEIFVTPNGVDASSWPHFDANKALVPALLAQLVSQGSIAASTAPASPPTLTATAVQAGTGGNSITISFASPSATDGTVTITVAAKEVYMDLTPANIGTTLGTTAVAAEGLVYLSDPGLGEMPGSVTAAKLSAGPAFDLAVPELADNTKTAFTLAAASTDAGVELIQIDIVPDAGSPPTTFTLTASWTKTATGVTLSSLTTANPYEYLVAFSGQSGPLPAAGSITLKGGAAAKPASASLLS